MHIWDPPDPDLLVHDKCLPQIFHPSSNYMTDCEIPDMTETSLYMDGRSGGNHTTTINIYKVNYGALIITLMFFALIMMVFSNLWKGNKIRVLKPPVPVLYYLAKTGYKQEHAELCMTLIEKEDYDVNSTNSDIQFSVFLKVPGSKPDSSEDLLNLTPTVVVKCPPTGSVQKFEDKGARLVFSSSDRSSKLKCPSQNSPHVASKQDTNITKTVIRGCNINCQNNSGFTVLHLASSRGNLSLVQYLILKGADPAISTAESILPNEMAAMKGHEETAKYLKNEMICMERT
ncbi:hypothetical protein AVEN_246182-1 [Araneus ventricosus]|uniref:Alpha-latrotoxin n=1 Tax=Araneus ventricosus TaxID=182803 RepID=A0A4Y2J3Q5_ARAVE|nr:hypothetical protein AVEN_246182-1 [Araneus ventricosus]